MASRGKDWPGRELHDISLIDLQNFPAPMPSIEAYRVFIEKFDELTIWSDDEKDRSKSV